MLRPALLSLAIVLLPALAAGPAHAQDEEISTVREATAVLEETLSIREEQIPAQILKEAHAVAIIPGVIKVGFLIGGRRGRGVLLVQRDDSTWSAPAFLTLTGGSFGLQAGASSTDVVLVFRNRGSVQSLLDGKVTLGGTATVAAGPTGRSAEAATDARLKAEIYAYSRSRGAFAGISLDGGSLRFSSDSNRRLYGDPSVHSILYGGQPAPSAANRLQSLLQEATP